MIVLITDENLYIATLISGCGIYKRGSMYIGHVHTTRIKEVNGCWYSDVDWETLGLLVSG